MTGNFLTMISFYKIPAVSGICASLLLAGCSFGTGNTPAEVNGFKLDTYVTITAYDNTDKSVLDEALRMCDEYEKIFSMHDKASELWCLNHNETGIVSEDLGNAIDKGLQMYELSNGSFQITIGSVSGLWDFRSGTHIVPEDSALKEALQYTDDSKISVSKEGSGRKVTKPSETIIDLGAVAKGYISGKLKEFLISKGCESAVINLGGNVCCLGDKNGSPFNIGVRKPFGEASDTVAVFELNDMSLITSGVSERYFKGDDGRIYHHILDPSTGYPYDNGLYQVSVITKDPVDGDCLSTLCFALGLDEGLELIEDTPDTEALFITSDGALHYSSGAEKYLRR